MENTRPHEISRGRVLSYAATSLDSCEMILQNNFEPQNRSRVFSLVLKIQLFDLNTNKNLMVYFSKDFLELP